MPLVFFQARHIDIRMFGGVHHVYCTNTGQKLAQVDLVRGFAHYTGVTGGSHAGATAIIKGGINGLIAALATGIRNGRDDRDGAEVVPQKTGPVTATETAAKEEPIIEFHRVTPGYYQVVVDGVERPITIARDGKAWRVQAVDASSRHRATEAQYVGHRTLGLAQLVAERVWDAICYSRAEAEAEAIKINNESAEITRSHAEALEMNARIVYVEGHGTRAYNLTDVARYQDGTLLFSVRPVSGGMEWTYDRRGFGTKPF